MIRVFFALRGAQSAKKLFLFSMRFFRKGPDRAIGV